MQGAEDGEGRSGQANPGQAREPGEERARKRWKNGRQEAARESPWDGRADFRETFQSLRCLIKES